MFIDPIAEQFNWEVDLVFPLFSEHYLLLSSPSKLISVPGQQLNIFCHSTVMSVTNGCHRCPRMASCYSFTKDADLIRGRTDGRTRLPLMVQFIGGLMSSQALLCVVAESNRRQKIFMFGVNDTV